MGPATRVMAEQGTKRSAKFPLRKVVVVGGLVVLVAASSALAVYYYLGYAAINSLRFSFWFTARYVHNQTITFQLGLGIFAGGAGYWKGGDTVLPVAVTDSRFTMVTDSRLVGTVTLKTAIFTRGYGPGRVLNFSITVPPGETSLCSRSTAINQTETPEYWTMTMDTQATSGWVSKHLVLSETQQCFWNWIT